MLNYHYMDQLMYTLMNGWLTHAVVVVVCGLLIIFFKAAICLSPFLVFDCYHMNVEILVVCPDIC